MVPEAKHETETAMAPPRSVVEEAVDITKAIHEVRSTSGEWNWVLCGWERRDTNPNMPPPSPCRGGA